MAVKVRADLVAVAERVQREFSGGAALITRAHIEAAIAAHDRFSDSEYRALVRLRSQAFKAPDKMLKIS
jgi:hypothetical protein